MVKTSKARARNRRSSPRDSSRTSKQPASTPIDPVAILEQIAGNKRLKPTPRVQACKELIRLRLMLGKAETATLPDAKKTEKIDRLDAEINHRALQMLRPRGQA